MDELAKNVIDIFEEEHQDWVKHLKEAEEKGEGVDVNLGGNFSNRIKRLLVSFRDCKERQAKKQKRGLFSR